MAEQESNFDAYINLIKKIIKIWYYVLISIMISILIGFYVSKSSNRIYSNKLVFLIQGSEDKNRRSRDNLDQLQMFEIQSNIDDELGIISSFPVINQTIKELDIKVSYFTEFGLITPEIYRNSPINVIFNLEVPQPVGLMFEVDKINKEGYTLSVESKEGVDFYNYLTDEVSGKLNKLKFSKRFNFGDEVKINNSTFKVIVNNKFDAEALADKKLYFCFNDIKELTYRFQSNLKIERISIKSSLVDVSLKGNEPELVTDFLNTLANVYLNRNLEKKNLIADKTIDFIDKQITGIADSLGLTADQLKNFRIRNNVMDINFLSQSVYQQMRELENQRAQLLVASKYYDYIKEYFENNKDLMDLNAPSSMGVDDPQLQSLIIQLTSKYAQRSLQLDGKSVKNPMLPLYNAEINNLKKTILENIDYIVNTSNITINDINNRIAKLKSQVDNLPGIEKELKNIEREFQVNDGIYTFLLSTRADAQIARASNSPDYEVIDPAKYESAEMVSPKKKLVFLGSFFIGMLIPIGLIVLLSSINNSTEDKKDIEKISNFPFIGCIANNDKDSFLSIIEYPKSLIAESFRSVRTSLQFFHKGQPKQKILVTSSMSGDGKTFIAMNLASAYSNFGKKTLLIEFDLRNPKISSYMGLEFTKGLSSYLINDARLEEIIQKTSVKNLDVIVAGDIPPNPVELIASDNTRNMFDILQSIYDYIIIDSPPVGVVTDSYLLMEYSDANLFVVRLNHTNKKLFTSIIKDFEHKEIPNIAILINDDEEKTQSSYYDNSDNKMSYLGKKLHTLKKLVKQGKKTVV